MMTATENSGVDNFRRRGFLKLESTSRTVVWDVKNYHSILTSEHPICSNSFRLPTLSNFLFYLSLSLHEESFSLKVIRTIKSSYSFVKTDINSVIKVSITFIDKLNQIQLSKEFIMTKEKSSVINVAYSPEKFLKEASLQVRCTMTLTDFESFQACQRKEIIRNSENNYVPSISAAELKAHLEVILAGDEGNRAKIIVQGDVYPVHRSILCSDSPVFAAMFAHDTSEKAKNEIYIDDLSEETIGEILTFMYFGSTSKLSLPKAIDVYTGADKYAIMRLKEKCSRFLISNLSKESVLNILLVADRHGDEELKESTIRFLVNEAADVIESDEFLLFVESESELARCILLHVLKNISK